MERPQADDTDLDDLEVPKPDADAVTGGALQSGKDDEPDPSPERNCTWSG
ncbi:MAG TPA: hypothetical protein VM942_04190 [Acidimicrobiales bacterium]|nr:hypothetical protein [Acidimicrobiales bacterium]